MTEAELIKIASPWLAKYSVVGIRTQEPPFALGAIAHKSVSWDRGCETNRQLTGICATNIRNRKHAVRQHTSNYNSSLCTYYGDHIAVVAGNHYHYGRDAGEVVISDPVVVSILA